MGLKTAQRKQLERIARRKIPPDMIISPEVTRTLCDLSKETGRQIGILIDRSGQIPFVIVGDHKQIVIPALSALRSSGGRLRGLRCVHTHLGSENINEDDLMDLLFLRLDVMAIIKMLPNGLPERIYGVHLIPTPKEGKDWQFLPPIIPTQQNISFTELITALEEEFARLRPLKKIERNRDRAILVSVTATSRSRDRHTAQESMDELAELARTAGVIVLDTVIQHRKKVHAKYLLGKGKLGEIMLAALRLQANLLIFDMEMNPSQIRSITDHTELRVIDRTQLILDIFAQRALSREGKLQIEMAQLKYMMPRLSMRDDALSRLTGGIGARGPGETKLEVDRRRINDRLTRLAKELKAVSRERHHRRNRRRKKNVPVISLVGYTNAGKSTLLNTLTSSDIIAEDKLFATLDPTSRRLRFPHDIEVIITDTVGFIRNLPAELLQAFKATLEELYEADLLVHVIDASNPRFKDQIRVVEDILVELELHTIPCLRIFNKIDRLPDTSYMAAAEELDGLPLCALDPTTFGAFLARAHAIIQRTNKSGVHLQVTEQNQHIETG